MTPEPPWEAPPRPRASAPRRGRAAPEPRGVEPPPRGLPAAPAGRTPGGRAPHHPPRCTRRPEVAGWGGQGSRADAPARRASPGRPARVPTHPEAPPGCPAGSCCSRAAELSLLRGRRGLGSTSRSGSLRASGDPGGGERRRRGLNRGGAPAPAAGWGLRRPAGVALGRFPARPSAVRPSAGSERGAPAEA